MGRSVIGNEEAMSAIMQGENVFITGPAGCGKSMMISTLREFFHDSFLFAAPTGIAALNIGGVTAHKAFGLTFGVTSSEDYSAKSKGAAMLMSSEAIDGIVIDEISMIRSDKLKEIDMKLRYHRKVNKPFGGLQVIVFGDGFQIKPVLKSNEVSVFRENYGSEVPFGSPTWDELDFTCAYLPKVYRQADPEFSKHLNNIRIGKDIPSAVDYFNRHCVGAPLNDAVTLCTTNKSADSFNRSEFNKLQAECHKFTAVIQGEFKDRPVDEILELKEGLKVMIVVNDCSDNKKRGPDYVNGTVGIITKISNNFVIVSIDGKLVPVGKYEWKNITQVPQEKKVTVEREVTNPDGSKEIVKTVEKKKVLVDKEIGKYLQYPFKMGYAITGHKAQGLTLDKVNIDMGYGTFTPGQAYVMLSRATSVDGLRLLRKLKVKDIIVDYEVLSFYKEKFPSLF